MVKKKVSKKKAVRRKTSKKKDFPKKVSMTADQISRSDFEAFQFGVKRLKDLREELDKINTEGFYREEKAIRAKLKNVSEIPNIERAIKELKNKVKKKGRKHGRKKPTKIDKVKENVDDVKESLPGIRRALTLLTKEVHGITEEKKRKKGLVDPGVDVLIDADFSEFISDIKGSVSDRVKRKEEALDETLKKEVEKQENILKRKELELKKVFSN
jgi:hypothetical protein